MIKVFVLLLFFPFALFAQDLTVVEQSTDWRGLVQLARKAYREKDYQNSMLFYQTALSVTPNEIDLSNEIAQTQYRLKQYQASEEIYKSRIQGTPVEKAKSYHNLGNISMQNKDYLKAIDHYKNAIRNNPNNPKTQYNLSEAMRRQKEKEKQNPPPKNEDDQNKEKDPEKDKKPAPNPNNSSALSDNSIERELDKLMRKEADTKRKLARSKKGESNKISKKEW